MRGAGDAYSAVPCGFGDTGADAGVRVGASEAKAKALNAKGAKLKNKVRKETQELSTQCSQSFNAMYAMEGRFQEQMAVWRCLNELPAVSGDVSRLAVVFSLYANYEARCCCGDSGGCR